MSTLQQCDICGGEKPSDMIERTSVETIAPLEADVCEPCQLVQDHELPEDVCMKCGDVAGASYYMEVEFPLGEAGILGQISGTLCGDCAGWVGCEVNYEAVDADPDALSELVGLLDEEQERTAEQNTA